MSEFATTAPIMWADVVRRAGELWLHLDKAKSIERRFGEVSGYAVDIGVPILFADPKGVRAKPELLGLQGDDELTDLSFLLGAHSLLKVEGRAFLLQGHQTEFQSVYDSLSRQAENASEENATDFFARIARVTGETGNKPHINGEQEFLKLRLTSDAMATASGRFTLLRHFIRRTRLRQASTYLKDFGLLDADEDAIKKLAKPWFNELRDRKSRGAANHLVMNDAIALAHLANLNSIARDHEAGPFLLLTADDTIHSIARDTNIPGAEYIVDPRSFLEDFKVSVEGNGGQKEIAFGLEDWLGLILSPLARSSNLDADVIRRAIKMLGQDEDRKRGHSAVLREILREIVGERVETLSDEWRQYLRLNMNANARTVLGEFPIFSELGSAILGKEPSKSEAILNGWKVKEYGDLTTTALVAGVYTERRQLAEEKGGRDHQPLFHTRMPMTIRYRSNNEQERFWSELKSAVDKKKINEIQPREDIGDQYLVHLVSAQLHASFGNWRAAEATARMAVILANFAKSRDAGTEIDGVEARYARAVSLRHLMKSPSDLTRQMEVISDLENFIHELRGEDADIRVSLERISLELMARYYARYHGADWGDVPNDFQSRDVLDLALAARPVLDSAKQEPCGSDTERLIRLNLIKQAGMNGISAFLLKSLERGTFQPKDSEYEEIQPFIIALNEVREKAPANEASTSIILSNYFHMTYWVGEFVREVVQSNLTEASKCLVEVRGFGRKVYDANEISYDRQKVDEVIEVLTKDIESLQAA